MSFKKKEKLNLKCTSTKPSYFPYKTQVIFTQIKAKIEVNRFQIWLTKKNLQASMLHGLKIPRSVRHWTPLLLEVLTPTPMSCPANKGTSEKLKSPCNTDSATLEIL